MTARTAHRRRAILDAALELVDGGGLEALTIGRLAQASGASNGSIYHHFGSRAGVLAALYRESFHHCIGRLTPALDDRDAADVVRDLAGRYLDWVQTHPTRAMLLYAAALSGDLEDGGTELESFKADAFSPIATWMADRTRQGELRGVPPWAVDPVVMGPAHECARRYLGTGGAIDLTQVRPVVQEAAWAIVRPDA